MTLRFGDTQSVQRMFANLSGDVEKLVDSIIELVYFMRGSISYEEMMYRTPGERQRMSKFIEKRFESQKGAFSPVY